MKKYENFVSHLTILERAYKEDLENEFIISGIIDKYCIQFELGWKMLKELLIYEGSAAGKTGSPREIIKASYQCFDFLEDEIWMAMLRDRNDTSHIYDGAHARELMKRILDKYIPAFQKLEQGIEDKYGDILKSI